MANSPARAVVDVGSVIADTYKIEALIGRGGMGAVFLASHARLPGKQVAIKLLHEGHQDSDALARFRREAEIASRLGHPNIVAVHDFNVTADGTPYLVLEYLRGETLAQRLSHGPLPLEQTMSIIRQVGSALAAAHREGIVHRDLKPQNIFLEPAEVAGRMVEIAKVLDFGISKIRGSQTVKTQETALLGTPQYMAPEQAMGQHSNVDERTDVFALGAIVHEMLTGQPAFTGASIPEVVFKVVYEQPLALPDTVPTNIVAAVTQAMTKASAERFPTVGAFVEALTGQPLTQMRPALPSPDTGFASGSQNVADHAALANTMDSGDYPAPPPRSINAGPLVSDSAATVDSMSARTPAPPPRHSELELAHTVTPPNVTVEKPATVPPVPVTPAPRKVWPLIAVGAVAIAVTAAVMFFVMDDDDDPGKRDRNARVADKRETKHDEPRRESAIGNGIEPRREPVRTPEVREPASKPAASKPADPKPADPKPADPKPDRPKRPPAAVVDTDSDPGSSEMRDLLTEAEAAVGRGDRPEALRLTNKIVNQSGDTRIAAEAHVLRGILYCNDITQANGELRQIPKRFPGLIKKLKSACNL